MAASPSTVITLGLGSFGSVNLLPTLGYGVLIPSSDGQFNVAAFQGYISGPRAAQLDINGATEAQCYISGPSAAQ